MDAYKKTKQMLDLDLKDQVTAYGMNREIKMQNILKSDIA